VKLRGQWWLPAAADRPVSGHVRVAKSGRPALVFKTSAEGQEAYAFDAPTLHGQLDDGTPVTLWARGFHPIQDRDGGPADEQRWRRSLTTVLVGAHLGDQDAELFSESALQFQHLAMWSRHPTVVDHDAPAPVHDSANVSPYDAPFSVEISLLHPQIVRHRADGSGDAIMNGSGNDSEIAFRSDPPASLAFHDHLAMDARNLLTFSFQAEAHVTRQRAVSEGREVIIYRYRTSKLSRSQKSGHNMVVTALTSDVAKIFEAWWAVASDYYPLTQILAGRYYTSRAFLEHSVSAAVAALEATYDRLDHLPSNRMDPEAFADRRQWHLEHEEDEDFRALLQGLGNRQSLRQKLKRISRDLSEPVVTAAGIGPKQWVIDVMDVRDQIAHTGSHVSGVQDEGEVILERVDRDTRAILSLVLCRLLGLEGEALMRSASVLSQVGPLVRADSMPYETA